MYKVGCRCCENIWDCGSGPEQKIKDLESKLLSAVECLKRLDSYLNGANAILRNYSQHEDIKTTIKRVEVKP